MRIRLCEKKDQEAWVRLNKEFMAYEITDEDFWNKTEEVSHEEMGHIFEEALRQKEHITLILLEKEGPCTTDPSHPDSVLETTEGYHAVGFANLMSIFSVWAGGKALILDDLFIQEHYRGQGLGREAMEWIENFAREEGYRRLHFLSEDSNQEAHKFYTRLGYPSSGMSFYVRYLKKGPTV